MRLNRKRWQYFFLLLISSHLTACLGGLVEKKQTHFYALSVIPLTTKATVKSFSIQSLGVGPVHLPRLLKHPQIVTRKKDTNISLTEFHQWAGDLEEEITQNIVDNLMNLLSLNTIRLYPWHRQQKPEYQIILKIERFDGTLGESVVLKGQWSIINLRNQKEVFNLRSVITQAISGNDYSSYVEAQSRALAVLSKELSEKIRGL